MNDKIYFKINISKKKKLFELGSSQNKQNKQKLEPEFLAPAGSFRLESFFFQN